MNPLELFILKNNMDEIKSMDSLQLHGGIISDNCVMACDVAEKDCEAAVKWLAGGVAFEGMRQTAGL